MKKSTKYYVITVLLIVVLFFAPLLTMHVSGEGKSVWFTVLGLKTYHYGVKAEYTYEEAKTIFTSGQEQRVDFHIAAKMASTMKFILFAYVFGITLMVLSHFARHRSQRKLYWYGATIIFLTNVLYLYFLPNTLSQAGVRVSYSGLFLGKLIQNKVLFATEYLTLRIGWGWLISTILSGYVVFFYRTRFSKIRRMTIMCLIVLLIFSPFPNIHNSVSSKNHNLTMPQTYNDLIITPNFSYGNTVRIDFVSSATPLCSQNTYYRVDSTIIVRNQFIEVTSVNTIVYIKIRTDFENKWIVIQYYEWFNKNYLSSIESAYNRSFGFPLPAGTPYQYRSFSRRAGSVFEYDYAKAELPVYNFIIYSPGETISYPFNLLFPHEMLMNRSGVCEDFMIFWGAIELANDRRVTYVMIAPVTDESNGHAFIVDQWGYAIENQGYYYSNLNEALSNWRNYFSTNLIVYMITLDPTYGVIGITTSYYT